MGGPRKANPSGLDLLPSEQVSRSLANGLSRSHGKPQGLDLSPRGRFRHLRASALAKVVIQNHASSVGSQTSWVWICLREVGFVYLRLHVLQKANLLGLNLLSK